MGYKFREDLLTNNNDFNKIFKGLFNNKDLEEYDEFIWNIINRDKTPIRINGEPLAFKDLFHLDLNEGRCRVCALELVFLLDKFGIYSEAVECINDAFKGTLGSTYGGHWYVEAHINNDIVCYDTSLVVKGSVDSFSKLGHKVSCKHDIDSLFKKYPSLIDYYDNMIINKNFL